MKAKKALKKLYKKSSKKAASHSLRQLKSLKNSTSLSGSSSSQAKSEISSELKDLAGQVLLSAAHELAQPLNPVLSWFDGGGGVVDLTSPANDPVTPKISKANIIPTQNPNRSVVSLPLKSPPCKRCPALQNGICKCAAKKFKMTA